MSSQIRHFLFFNFHFYFLVPFTIESAADAQIFEIIDELAISGRVVDLHHFDADPETDSTYHPDADSDFFDADPDPTFHPDADPDPELDPSFKKGSNP
jgi:hypothetical protein